MAESRVLPYAKHWWAAVPDPGFDTCAVVVLAAGNSRRMGAQKQALDLAGKPLLRRAAETALAAGCGHVVVVLGADAENLRPLIQDLDLKIAVNQQWSKGIGTSIQTGLQALSDLTVDGIVLVLADQPFVDSRHYRDLIAQHRLTGKAIVASRYSDTAGVPAFFSKEVFPALLALPPDKGCKEIILGRSEQSTYILYPDASIDIDTPEDYSHALSSLHSRPS